MAWWILVPVLVLAALILSAPVAGGQCQVEMAKILASDGVAGDRLAEVALSGDTLVVGAQRAGNYLGAAYVFYRDQGGANRWGEVAKLVPPGGSADIRFGSSVAIAGDTIVVGAFTAGGGEGALYVFERDLGGTDSWGMVKTLVAANPMPTAYLGLSVSIWGDTIVGGAPEELSSYSGAAYVFERDLGGADNWGQAAKLIQSDGGIGVGYFAGNIAIRGDTIASGAHGAYYNGLESGAVYVFERDAGGPGNWGEVQKLVPGDVADFDFFGDDLSLSGDTLAIYSDSAGGSVYVFERNGTWAEHMKIPIFGIGRAVALDGDTLLIQVNSGPGGVYAFGRDAGGVNNWGFVREFLAADGTDGDRFGRTLAVDADTYAVGAAGDDDRGSDSGSAYIFSPSPLACPESYCAGGTTSNGCTATIATRGIQSATASSGFELVARGVEGDRYGIFFFGMSGRRAVPWGDPASGCTSFMCVSPPLIRGGMVAGTGTPGLCDGTFTYDLNMDWTNRPSANPGVGTTVQAQLWYRDPDNPCTGAAHHSGTALSNAVEFVVGP